MPVDVKWTPEDYLNKLIGSGILTDTTVDETNNQDGTRTVGTTFRLVLSRSFSGLVFLFLLFFFR